MTGQKKRPADAGLFHQKLSHSAAAVPVDVPARGAEADRLQFEAGDAGGDIEPGLSLHADRLQSVSVGRTADQEITAAAEADRGVGADAAITSSEIAAPKPAVRRTH